MICDHQNVFIYVFTTRASLCIIYFQLLSISSMRIAGSMILKQHIVNFVNVILLHIIINKKSYRIIR